MKEGIEADRAGKKKRKKEEKEKRGKLHGEEKLRAGEVLSKS